MNTAFQKPWIRALTTFLVIALMTGIFLFSHQGKQSETTSESFAFVIIDTVHPEYEEATAEEQIDIWNTAQRIVRKAAHIVEYLVLGFLIRLCLESWFGWKKKFLWIAFAIGALYAVSDEVHQYFIPGRSSEVLDVLMDSAGVFPGVLLAVQFIKLVYKHAEEGEYPMESWSRKKIVNSLLLSPVFGALLTLCLELGLSFIRKDTPGTLSRHLAFFAVCTGVVAGAVLLCAITRPVRRFWDWLDKSLLSPETRKPWIDIVFAVLAGAMLLHHVYVILYYPQIPAGATKLAPLWIVLAPLAVLLGKTWKHRGFLFTSFFLIYTFENLFLNKRIITGEAPVYFSSALYALFLAYSVFFVLRPQYRRIFLQTFCALWCLAGLAYCGAGLYTSWTGIQVKNLAKTAVFVYKGRLNIFAEPTISASNASAIALVAMVGFAAARHWPVKILYIIPCLAGIMATTLTDTRSNIVMLSFMLAGVVALGVWGLLGKCTKKLSAGARIPLVAVSVLGCFALSFYLSWIGQRAMPDTFVEVRDKGGIVVTAAQADALEVTPAPEAAPESAQDSVLVTTSEPTPEPTPAPTPTPPPPSFVQRDVEVTTDENTLNRILTGRWNIWKTSQKYVEEHPETLKTGLTTDGSAAKAVNRSDHVHNILIQTVLEGGVPGLLLFLALLGYFLFHAIRLWAHWELPLWQRVLPMPVFSLLLMEMAECLTHFAFGHPPMTLMYFFMGCTVAASLSLKKDPGSAAPAQGD